MFAKYPPRICERRRQGSRLDRASMRARGSNVPGEVSHAAFESFCKLRKSFERDLLFRPFDVANVISCQIRLFRQLFLAQTGLLPLDADGFSQNTIDSARRRMHSFLSKQNAEIELPTNGWYFSRFCACHSTADFPNNSMWEGRAVALIGNMRQCEREGAYRKPAPRTQDFYSDGISRFQEQRSPNWILNAVVTRMLISPASIFWRFRVAISARSASSSCVKPLRTRSRRTLAPKTLIRFHSFLDKATTHYIAFLC